MGGQIYHLATISFKNLEAFSVTDEKKTFSHDIPLKNNSKNEHLKQAGRRLRLAHVRIFQRH